jgi:exopolyphosphatase/pppGpp-phosphohydrolase
MNRARELPHRDGPEYPDLSLAHTQTKVHMTSSTVLLHIGSEQTKVTVRKENGDVTQLLLTLGSQLTSLGYFRHTPPTPEEMETAIMVVEDEIMRVRHDIPAGARLVSNDNDIRAIARLAGVAENESMPLSVDAVERTFDRLALVINGHPARFEGIPDGNDFAATLLILREFMHHLQFAQIVVKGTKFVF